MTQPAEVTRRFVQSLADGDNVEEVFLVIEKQLRANRNGNQYLHLVKAIQGPRFQIGNNRGRVNGWVSANAIFGKLVLVEA